MQFKIGNTTVDIDFADPTNYEAVGKALAANTAVQAELSNIAAGMHFQAWDRDGDVEQSTIDKIIGIALEDGVEQAEQYMVENNFDTNPSDYYHYCGGRDATSRHLDAFFTEFEELNGIEDGDDESEEFREAVLEAVRPIVEEKLPETDKSVPADFFNRRDEAKIAFIQGYGTRGYLDDIGSSHADTLCQSDTVKPNMSLMLQFKLMNISPVEFVEYYKAKRGHDLANPEFGDGVTDYYRRQLLENAQAWRYACAVFNGEDVTDFEIPDWLEYGSRSQDMADVIRGCRDLDRPSAVSYETLEVIFDNAGYGGVATWCGRVNAKEVMQGAFAKSFVARGGQIGVHDFGGGAGHFESAENEVLIDLRDGKLVVGSRLADKVYGFTRKATDTQTRSVALSECVRYRDESWRTVAAGENGLYVDMVMTGAAGDGRHVFHVSSKNVANVTEGPLQDFEICCTLDEAKAFAVDALNDMTLEKTAEATNAPRM